MKCFKIWIKGLQKDENQDIVTSAKGLTILRKKTYNQRYQKLSTGLLTEVLRSCIHHNTWWKAKVLVAQSCLTMAPGSSVHGILQARILEWVAIPFSQEFFQTQGSNPGLLHCRWIIYHLSHQRSPMIP